MTGKGPSRRVSSCQGIYTVVGGKGFIGEAIARRIIAGGGQCRVPARDWVPARGEALGRVIFAAGVTGDFAQRPFDGLDAHVALPSRILEHARFDSFLYLSSTRMYERAASTREDSPIEVRSSVPSELYNISKLAGEAVCLARTQATIRVVRLSNVVGPDFNSPTFLPAIIRMALSGEICLETAAESAKDYILLEDVLDVVLKICHRGRHRLYNVASGRNLSNEQLLLALAAATGCRVSIAADAPQRSFPEIDIDRIRSEFDFEPAAVLERLPGLVDSFRAYHAQALVGNGSTAPSL